MSKNQHQQTMNSQSSLGRAEHLQKNKNNLKRPGRHEIWRQWGRKAKCNAMSHNVYFATLNTV